MNDNMIDLSSYIRSFTTVFPHFLGMPWEIPGSIENILREKIKSLSADFKITGDIAIHQEARVEEHVVLKGTVIIGAGCFIGAHAYIRGGVFLDDQSIIGPGCEIKSSMIFRQSALAHFNFVGDSVIGEGINMEAGSVIANHYNERPDKTICALLDGRRTVLPVTKFGALVGDYARIGANAVLSPGTILKPGSIVRRLELVEQGY